MDGEVCADTVSLSKKAIIVNFTCSHCDAECLERWTYYYYTYILSKKAYDCEFYGVSLWHQMTSHTLSADVVINELSGRIAACDTYVCMYRHDSLKIDKLLWSLRIVIVMPGDITLWIIVLVECDMIAQCLPILEPIVSTFLWDRTYNKFIMIM